MGKSRQSAGNSLFLRNAWYAGGFAEELDTQPMFSRKILGESVLFYRDRNGTPAAIGNLCPHRFAPLDRGTVVDGQVRCGYHGLGFDRTGKCVHNPHGKTAGLAVAAYPLAVRHGILWLWMGDAGKVDYDLLPRFPSLEEDRFHVRRGYLHGEANYQLMSDNILDLSHIEFLHPALGTDAVSRAKVETTHDERTVTTTRRMLDEVLPPTLAKVYKSGEERVNRTMEVVWSAPSNMLLAITVEPVDEAQNWTTGAQSLHLFTPETDTSAHYFYLASLDREVQDAHTADAFAAALKRAFIEEDKAMIDAQAKAIGHAEIMDLKPALLPIDKAAVLARRKLQKLIADEVAGVAANSSQSVSTMAEGTV